MEKIIFLEDDTVRVLSPITDTTLPSRILCGGVCLEDAVRRMWPHACFAHEKGFVQGWACADSALQINGRAVPVLQEIAAIAERIRAGDTEGKLGLFQKPWLIASAQLEICASNFRFLRSFYAQYAPGVYIGKNVVISEHAVLDPSKGEIILDDRVRVEHFSYIQGPTYIGPDSIARPHSAIGPYVSAGRNVKLGGEIEASVVQSYTNKAHFGYIGHSYIGSWVNFAAGTTTSNLKFTYGNIRVDHDGKKHETALQFLGAVFGDYVKTSSGTTIDPGKIIGVNAYIAGRVDANVPAGVLWDDGEEKMKIDVASALLTQKRMFQRRGKVPNEDEVARLRNILRDGYKTLSL